LLTLAVLPLAAAALSLRVREPALAHAEAEVVEPVL
jgi:hypothetical protein